MASLEERISNLENLLHVVITNINVTRQFISNGFTKIDENFTNIHTKIDQLSDNTDINFGKVDGEMNESFDKVHLTLASIKEEIAKINTVTNYDELVTNMKLVKGGKE